MRDRFRVGMVIALVGSMMALADPTVAAKKDPVIACAAFKLKNAGHAASAILACHAGAAQKGLEVDSECIDTAAAKLTVAFAKAEEAAIKAGSRCPEGGEIADLEGELDAFVAHVVGALRLELTASKCAAKKLGTVGKYAQRLLGAHASHRTKPDPVKFAEKTAAAEAAVLKAFGKVDEKGTDCQTSGDAEAMTTEAEHLVIEQVCDDNNQCTVDALAGAVCQNTAVACAANYACDFRTGSCEYANCCLMSANGTLCVVEIPVAQVPTSAAFCQGVDTANVGLSLLNHGPNCIGWRAAGADDCF